MKTQNAYAIELQGHAAYWAARAASMMREAMEEEADDYLVAAYYTRERAIDCQEIAARYYSRARNTMGLHD